MTHHLDDAIDSVAARMTRVEEDDALAGRILAALPDRSPIYWWTPRLAITSVLAAGALIFVLQPFSERSTDVLRTAVIGAPTVELATTAAEHRTTVAPAQIGRRTIGEPLENDRGTIVDFERSLEAIEAPVALSLVTLAPSALREDAPLTVQPLTIADLPLAADSISPR